MRHEVCNEICIACVTVSKILVSLGVQLGGKTAAAPQSRHNVGAEGAQRGPGPGGVNLSACDTAENIVREISGTWCPVADGSILDSINQWGSTNKAREWRGITSVIMMAEKELNKSLNLVVVDVYEQV